MKRYMRSNWLNLKTSLKPYCGRFLLDIYRPFLNISLHRMGDTRQLLLRCSSYILPGLDDNCSCVVLATSSLD